MTPSEREDLLARPFEADLTADEARRLEEVLSDPEAAARFRGLADVEGLLRARFAPRRALAVRVLESVQSERRRRLTSRVMGTLRLRRRSGSNPNWIAAAAAIGVSLAAILLVMSRPSNSGRIAGTPAPKTAPAPPTEKIRNLPEQAPVVPAPRPDPIILAPPPPEPTQEPEPGRPPAVPAHAPIQEPPKPETRIAGILVERSEGKPPAGSEIAPGSGLETGAGSVTLRYPDGTRLELARDTALLSIQDRVRKGRGKRVSVGKGTVTAEVTKQPADEPLVITTPHGEVRVLGTALRLTVDPAQTLVEVREGKVRAIRSRDGRSTEVGAGQLALVAPDLDLQPRSLSADEIVLLPQQARIAGPEWKLVADRRASSGVALEAGPTTFKVADHVRKRPSHATFTFYARADRDYRVWVRTASQATGDPWTRDLLTVDPHHAGANQKCPFFGTSDQTAFVFNGVAGAAGFHWLSGQEGREPLSVRFATTGLQTLRLYVAHPSIRVDAVWLSATQSARPPARQFPP